MFILMIAVLGLFIGFMTGASYHSAKFADKFERKAYQKLNREDFDTLNILLKKMK